MNLNPFRFFNRKTSDPHPTVQTFVTQRSQAGVTVDSEAALKSDTVYACVRYIAQTVAQLPWWAYAPQANGGSKLLNTAQYDSINSILGTRANEEMTAFRFRELMVSHALLYGNGFAEIERNGAGRALAVYPLWPDRVSIQLVNGRQAVVYQDPSRGQIIFTNNDDLFHLPNFYGEGVYGKSVIEFAAESIGWQRATELFGAAYFQNGIHPSGMITLKNALSPEAYRLFRQNLKDKFSGSRGAHEPFITDGEAQFTKFTIGAEEAQFTETLQHQVDVICRWFGVPPSKVGHLIHAGVRANVEQEAISVIQDTIMPWVVKFEQEANVKLFRENERAVTRMDLSALMRGDSAARAEYYGKMFHIGALNQNEIREMEDMNPIGDMGNQYYVQQQYIPLSMAGKHIATDAGSQTQEKSNGRPDQRPPSNQDGGEDDGLSDEEADQEFRRTFHLQRD